MDGNYRRFRNECQGFFERILKNFALCFFGNIVSLFLIELTVPRSTLSAPACGTMASIFLFQSSIFPLLDSSLMQLLISRLQNLLRIIVSSVKMHCNCLKETDRRDRSSYSLSAANDLLMWYHQGAAEGVHGDRGNGAG